MKHNVKTILFGLMGLLWIMSATVAVAEDSLSSWNDGAAKKNIMAFVGKVTTQGSPEFVPPAERIATFDNDGTLWPSHPMYTQLAFALDRIKALAPKHPEWKTKQPFKAMLDNDLEALGRSRRERAGRTDHGLARRHEHG